MRRLYCPSLSGFALRLEGDEAHHARNVLKAKVGQAFTLFDGEGHERTVTVTAVSRHALDCEPTSDTLAVDRRPTREITVAVAFPKARSRGMIVEKLVELGVRCIRPLITDRAAGTPEPERLEREALAALKQCGINHRPTFLPPLTLSELLTDTPSVVLLDTGGKVMTPLDNPITVAIGPEGGWTEEERQLVSRRWTLGTAVLRSETAAWTAAARLSAPPSSEAN